MKEKQNSWKITQLILLAATIICIILLFTLENNSRPLLILAMCNNLNIALHVNKRRKQKQINK